MGWSGSRSLVRQTVVHRSFFVEEVVKRTVNKATSFVKAEAGLSLEQMAAPESIKHRVKHCIKVFNDTNSKNSAFSCFSLGILINLFFLYTFILQNDTELPTCTFK